MFFAKKCFRCFSLLEDLSYKGRGLVIETIWKLAYEWFLATKYVGCIASKSFKSVFLFCFRL